MISAAEWSLHQQQWSEYRRWAASKAPLEPAPHDPIADVGTIFEWLPESVRQAERDPEKLGVQRIHYLLSLLESR
ncbi:MAG TPA: hypothetical protein VGN17_14190 [Bryobacteraceae bacterium]